MRFEQFSFGLIRIDGVTYERAVVVDRGEVRKRKKKHIPLANVDNLSVKPLIEEMTTESNQSGAALTLRQRF
jgi:hypothetical protein